DRNGRTRPVGPRACDCPQARHRSQQLRKNGGGRSRFKGPGSQKKSSVRFRPPPANEEVCMSYQQQLELFKKIIPPCGRSSGTFCEVQWSPGYGGYYCFQCRCAAPTLTSLSS